MRSPGRVTRTCAVLLTIVVTGTGASTQSRPVERVELDVSFLPQTEALCGGAAAAMVFRYWGDRHASVRQFEPLVDHSAGGIADAILIEAIQQRGWTTERLLGSEDVLRAEIDARRPPILLIEDRPRRYHYAVAVGVENGAIYLHDPTWGPSRRVALDVLMRVWQPTNFWMLRVTPGPRVPAPHTTDSIQVEPAPAPETLAPQPTVTPAQPKWTAASAQSQSGAASGSPSTLPPARPTPDPDSCDARVGRALDEIDASGLERSDELLLPLIRSCGDRAAPWRELAGVRFAQRRWAEASTFAVDALARDPHDRYAADVLGSSRFMQNDFDGALRAWNRLETPTLDTVRITGLTRTRYALLVQALGLEEERMLTAEAFGLARRRLESLPDLSSTRLALRPDDDRFAVADIAVVERATLPRGPMQWAASAAQALLEREASISLPGRTGQGETWSGSVRWWAHRPRVALAFAAPLTSGPRGVWRAETLWSEQQYGPRESPRREEQLGGSLAFSTWLAPSLRAEVSAGTGRWASDGQARRKMFHIGGSVERRFRNDHLAATASAARYVGSGSFALFGISLTARTSREPRPVVWLLQAGMTHAGRNAPLALWNGAGEGRARAPLLRAHRLLDEGRIDGPVFGRTLAHATLEAQHWFARPALVHVGAAAFLDVARASGRPDWSTAAGAQADVGVGVRLKVPGRSGTLRVDYANGIVDGARAWFIGWQTD